MGISNFQNEKTVLISESLFKAIFHTTFWDSTWLLTWEPNAAEPWITGSWNMPNQDKTLQNVTQWIPKTHHCRENTFLNWGTIDVTETHIFTVELNSNFVVFGAFIIYNYFHLLLSSLHRFQALIVFYSLELIKQSWYS